MTLENIKKEFQKLKKLNDSVSKNKKLSNLMTYMEQNFNVSIIDGSEDIEVFNLYCSISNARNF